MADKKKRSSKSPSKKISAKSPASKRPDQDRRVRQNDRLARVLRVLNLIQSAGKWNAESIAKSLGCSKRTVFRDLQVLEFAGIPWYFDSQDGCYRVRAGFRLPTLSLSDDLLLGQSLAVAVSQDKRLAIGHGAAQFTAQVAATASEKTQCLLEDAARIVDTFNLTIVDHRPHAETIKTVQRALVHKHMVAGIYASPYQDRARRLTIHPYRLCLAKCAWYLIGRLPSDEQPKTFRIARFKSLRISARTAELPDGFDLREYFGDAWGVFRGARRYDVKVNFAADAARLITEHQWHHSQRTQKLADGCVSIEFTVDGLEEILRWLLAHAGTVRVEAPHVLRDRYVEKMERAVHMQRQARQPANGDSP